MRLGYFLFTCGLNEPHVNNYKPSIWSSKTMKNMMKARNILLHTISKYIIIYEQLSELTKLSTFHSFNFSQFYSICKP